MRKCQEVTPAEAPKPSGLRPIQAIKLLISEGYDPEDAAEAVWREYDLLVSDNNPHPLLSADDLDDARDAIEDVRYRLWRTNGGTLL